MPKVIKSAGNKPKIIHEYVGFINSKTNEVSIAHMHSPRGWKEPGQSPEFDEYTLVLEGRLKVETGGETLFINEGEAVIIYAVEWGRYSTHEKNGAKYIVVCLPAFMNETVNRDIV